MLTINIKIKVSVPCFEIHTDLFYGLASFFPSPFYNENFQMYRKGKRILQWALVYLWLKFYY